MKILIVEDEIIPATYLQKLLQKEQYVIVGIAKTSKDAIAQAKKKKPELVLMDVMLKDNISGCEAALKIRQDNPKIFIVFLTAYSDKEMIDFAADSKAFGYLLKPYRDKEILATLQMAMRRLNECQKPQETDTQISHQIQLIDNFYFDTQLSILLKEEEEVPLGPIALKLLSILCQNTQQIVKIEYLLENLWVEPKSQQSLRSLIHRIREKSSHDLIININKLGYKIALKKFL